MSRYAFDVDRGTLTVAWSAAGVGTVATDVVAGATDADPGAGLLLAAELDRLADHLWEVYEVPESHVIGDEQAEHGVQAEIGALTAVTDAVLAPERPDPRGMMRVSYVRIEEAANRVGRALDELPDDWRAQIAAEAETEAQAVVRADLGDYTGRAEQAVWRERLEVNPASLDRAVRALTDDVDALVGLPGAFGIMAAVAAAAVLLQAGARAAGEAARMEPWEVFGEADNIEACSVQVPSLVVFDLESERRASSVVVGLLAEALAAQAGRIRDIDALLSRVVEAEQRAEEFVSRWPTAREVLVREAARLTPLDTERPAADLWEHILDGLHACWLLFDEYLDLKETLDDRDLDVAADADAEAAWLAARRQRGDAAWREALTGHLHALVDGYDSG